MSIDQQRCANVGQLLGGEFVGRFSWEVKVRGGSEKFSDLSSCREQGNWRGSFCGVLLLFSQLPRSLKKETNCQETGDDKNLVSCCPKKQNRGITLVFLYLINELPKGKKHHQKVQEHVTLLPQRQFHVVFLPPFDLSKRKS